MNNSGLLEFERLMKTQTKEYKDASERVNKSDEILKSLENIFGMNFNKDWK